MAKKKKRAARRTRSQTDPNKKKKNTARRTTPPAGGPTNLNPDAAKSSSGNVEKRLADNSFDPNTLDSAVIALPLLKLIEPDPKADQAVMIDLNLAFAGGRDQARAETISLMDKAIAKFRLDPKKYGSDV